MAEMNDETLFEILDRYDPSCAAFYRQRGYLIGSAVRSYAANLAETYNRRRDNLPDEFDFISHINECTRGMVYHARRSNMWYDDFIITLDGQDSHWSYDSQELQAHIDGLDFEIVQNEASV